MMKNIYILLLSFLFVQAPKAQTESMLWRVSGNGLKKPSYLFGTVHIYCQHDSLLKSSSIKRAVDSSNIVAMELNLNDYDVYVSIVKSASEPSSTDLRKLLDPYEYKVVDSASRRLLGAPLENLSGMSPISLLGRFYMSEEISGCAGPMPIDFTVATMARNAKKQSLGLETFEYQDSLLKTIPDSTQKKWLVSFCQDIPKARREFANMMKAYNAGHLEKLHQELLGSTMDMGTINQALLVDRNLRWAAFLQENMKGNSYFVAVGAGHLAGKEGLVALLTRAGYTVTPIIIK